MTDGNMIKSPWITPDRLRRQGALVVWEMSPGRAGLTPSLARLVAGRTTSVETFEWRWIQGVEPLQIGYAIIPPG